MRTNHRRTDPLMQPGSQPASDDLTVIRDMTRRRVIHCEAEKRALAFQDQATELRTRLTRLEDAGLPSRVAALEAMNISRRLDRMETSLAVLVNAVRRLVEDRWGKKKTAAHAADPTAGGVQ